MSDLLEKEYKIYLTRLDEFIPRHLHKFVLIKDDNIVNFFASYDQALKAGLDHFGNVAFLIKEVKKEEAVQIF